MKLNKEELLREATHTSQLLGYYAQLSIQADIQAALDSDRYALDPGADAIWRRVWAAEKAAAQARCDLAAHFADMLKG